MFDQTPDVPADDGCTRYELVFTASGFVTTNQNEDSEESE